MQYMYIDLAIEALKALQTEDVARLSAARIGTVSCLLSDGEFGTRDVRIYRTQSARPWCLGLKQRTLSVALS